MGKVLKLESKRKSKTPEYKNVYQKAFYNLFKTTDQQQHIIQQASKDVGDAFNLMSLPNEMIIELISAGTLKVVAKDMIFKRHYAEKLTEILAYLEAIEESKADAIGR